MHKNIIFDLGSVIFELRINNIVAALTSLTNKKFTNNMIKSIFNRSYFIDFETGKINFETFYTSCCSDFDINITKKQFIAAWNSCLPNTVAGVDAFLLSIKDKASLYALSNTNDIHLKYLIKNFSIMKVFKKIYASHEVNLRKPDLKIFKLVLKNLNILNPHDILFIDDNLENIKAAKLLGINSCLCFESVETLRSIVMPFLNK